MEVGCIEIFNYKKSSLDFYIKNYFPMYFMLQKLTLGGYTMDFNDPLLKALITEIEQKNDKKLFENYLMDLNLLLRNS
jgi:hypothetical protein